MNDLVQEYLGDFQLNRRSEENHANGYKLKPVSVTRNGCDFVGEGENSEKFRVPNSSEENVKEEKDYSTTLLKFIGEMLMEEEDLEYKPCMLHDCLALQAKEESLYHVLNNNNNNHLQPNSNHHFTNTTFTGTSSDSATFLESNRTGDFEPIFTHVDNQLDVSYLISSETQQFHPNSIASEPVLSNYEFPAHDSEQNAPNFTDKKHRYREDSDFMEDHRSSKQLADNVAETEPLEMYDDVLVFCPSSEKCGGAEQTQAKKKSLQNEQSRGRPFKGRRPKGEGKKQGFVNVVAVDMRSLLIQCAQAVSNFDSRTANDILQQIRQHSSPVGDYTARLAHYFANALEARLAGTGTALYTAVHSRRISAADILKAYITYITACPFKKMSNLFANATIGKLATGATTLHIIDFGILYGFQWPCLIHNLSERPGGPPKVRITGIDFPQPGFRPTERVVDTGRRLAKYCKRFGVPFEYNAIAQKWETIRVEDLKIEKNELVVVNSLFRLDNVLDETVMANSPRDVVLNLIKRINPEMFIQGVVNGTYNTPFFVTRFREALFHYSSMFDMFEATVPLEDENRLLFEAHVFGKDAINIIACEGTERIERPETYKQWQVRNLRAGFRQLPLDQEIVKYVRNKVKMDYHKDFSVDEDGKWMLQGWKGRVVNAISYLKPA